MPAGIPNPNTIKPDMSDYPYPGKSDKPAFMAWQREYRRRYSTLNPKLVKEENRAYRSNPENRARIKAYKSTPEYRERNRTQRKTPKAKARMKAYQKGEKYQAWKKAFKNSQEYKEWYKAYTSTPEYKARAKFYRSKPEYKARQRARWEVRKKSPEYRAKFKIIDKARKNDPRRKATRKKMEASRRQAKSVIPLTKEERQQLVVLEQKRLHLSETTGIVHHLDHIVPLAKGGIHHPMNLRIITAEENCSKGDKMTPEAMALIPQIQAIVQERKDWIRDDEDGNLMSLLV